MPYSQITDLTLTLRKCYYPSTRTKNKGLLALFSVHQGGWVDLLLDQLVGGGGGGGSSST